MHAKLNEMTVEMAAEAKVSSMEKKRPTGHHHKNSSNFLCNLIPEPLFIPINWYRQLRWSMGPLSFQVVQLVGLVLVRQIHPTTESPHDENAKPGCPTCTICWKPRHSILGKWLMQKWFRSVHVDIDFYLRRYRWL